MVGMYSKREIFAYETCRHLSIIQCKSLKIVCSVFSRFGTVISFSDHELVYTDMCNYFALCIHL